MNMNRRQFLVSSSSFAAPLILAPGCDLAPNIPLENLQAMARASASLVKGRWRSRREHRGFLLPRGIPQ